MVSYYNVWDIEVRKNYSWRVKMKKLIFGLLLALACDIAMAQTSQYEGTTLFELVLWDKQTHGTNTKRFAANVLFSKERLFYNIVDDFDLRRVYEKGIFYEHIGNIYRLY
jgi:hypothetical protein